MRSCTLVDLKVWIHTSLCSYLNKYFKVSILILLLFSLVNGDYFWNSIFQRRWNHLIYHHNPLLCSCNVLFVASNLSRYQNFKISRLILKRISLSGFRSLPFYLIENRISLLPPYHVLLTLHFTIMYLLKQLNRTKEFTLQPWSSMAQIYHLKIYIINSSWTWGSSRWHLTISVFTHYNSI
jgi:hypothetical protein